MKYNSKNKPLVCMMTQSTCYKGTSKMTPKAILWHSTGANNPSISRYVQPDDNAPNRDELIKIIGKNKYGNDWNHIYRRAGLNAWIGKLADGSVSTVQTMPWDYAPWGCGSGKKGTCNDFAVQFEICEDNLSNKAYFDKVYKEACELTAYLCDMYKIDPNGTVKYNGVEVPTILCHADSYKLGLGSNHGDVLYWFKKYGKTMDDVRKDVANLMKKPAAPVATVPVIKENDIVKIDSKATYTNGKNIPSWVKKKNWVVRSIKGDKALIDKSTDGQSAICSYVDTKYLTDINNFEPYNVTITATALNVRNGAGSNYAKVGVIKDKKPRTIVCEATSKSGSKWGLLASNKNEINGWISLSYTKKV